MLPYLTAETAFLRSFGNRSLLLILLCVLTRTGVPAGGASDKSIAKISALGLSLDINPAIVAVFGPIFALLVLLSLKLEADSLLQARRVLFSSDPKPKRSISSSGWAVLLFIAPTLSTAFMSLQFLLKVFPAEAGCSGWSWTRQIADFSYSGGAPSIYCLGDLNQGTPWIYPPWQTYFYALCVLVCAYLTFRLIKDWRDARTP